jgi:hypothetical protein
MPTTDKDYLALGFMTWYQNGIFFRVEGKETDPKKLPNFVEVRLVGYQVHILFPSKYHTQEQVSVSNSSILPI